MTWKHIAGLIGALVLPVVCGLSGTCSAESMDKVIGLSMVVAAGILGNANNQGAVTAPASSTVPKEKA